MARDISDALRAALYAEKTSQVILDLLTVEHEDLVTPYRFVAHPTNITSNGNLYTALAFQSKLIPDVEGELPRLDLIIDNVTRTLTVTIRSIRTPPTFTLRTVLLSTPNVVESGPISLIAFQVSLEKYQVRFSVGYPNITQEPFPAGVYTPTDYPGMFQAVDE